VCGHGWFACIMLFSAVVAMGRLHGASFVRAWIGRGRSMLAVTWAACSSQVAASVGETRSADLFIGSVCPCCPRLHRGFQ
jgi:mannose/fructose-specific phosphotransferase system component IIA